MTHNPLLASAWDDFCDTLKTAGQLPARAPDYSAERSAGYRLLSRNIALALAFHYENDDPLFPTLMHYFDPFRKQGGDNTDALYVGAPINGTDTYRIHGHRGSARYFAVTLVEAGDTPWGGRVAAVLFGHQLQVDERGFFELVISPDPQPGNWLQSTPSCFRVTIRQFFADWEHEEPMRAQIERVGGEDDYPPPPSPEKLQRGLAESARWVQASVAYWSDMINLWRARPNTFLSYRQLDDNAIDATPGGEPLICYWRLPEDEALIVRVTPPQADYWAVEFGNYWWESMDYRYRLSNTNCHYAALEENGELILVVSHQDTGYPNWLDPAGFHEGYITFRWIGATHYPVPECQQVPLTELERHLPANVKRCTREQRRAQLAARRRGIARRFSWL